MPVAPVDAEGENRFLDLAVESLVGGQKEVFGNLLRDGGRADEAAAGTDVLQVHRHSADEAADINAGMIVEILVFSRKERRLDAIGDRLDRHEKPVLPRVFLHQRAVAGMNARRHRRGILRQDLVIGKLLRDHAQIDGSCSRRTQKQEAAQPKEISNQSDHVILPVLVLHEARVRDHRTTTGVLHARGVNAIRHRDKAVRRSRANDTSL